jgi:hypothetical protein
MELSLKIEQLFNNQNIIRFSFMAKCILQVFTDRLSMFIAIGLSAVKAIKKIRFQILVRCF